ncbi:MAG TPA: homoserine dehydrogenase [Candidatus Acidoferrum sp.]|nr:homoserine dehydrogenase [Candidatus Acidoferrum sp.]
MRQTKLAFLGFGTVAQGCARHILRKQSHLEQEYGFPYKVVAISDPVKGSVLNVNEGIDLQRALQLLSEGKTLEVMNGKTGLSSLETIAASQADILVEATWTNLETGEPGLSHIIAALEAGMDVATSNKGPIALAFKKLMDLARSRGRQLRFESTVMSGTPLLNMREFCLAGAKISALRGILNGTTNYILTEMANGKSYAEALKRAQELGYAEADPSGDVEAYDPAAKITILANAMMEANLDFKQVEREGITRIEMKDLQREGKLLKLIASARRDEKGRLEASVKPTLVPATDMLAHVGGVMNALQISTDTQPDVTIIGPGAGGDSAGYGLLVDILTIHRLRLNEGLVN